MGNIIRPLQEAKEATENSTAVNPTKPNRRKLPEDPAAFDKALAPWRVVARPVIGGYNKGLKVAFDDPLDAEEIDGGLQAVSALLYQRGGEISGEILCLLFIAGTLGPRAAKYMADKRSKANENSNSMNVVVPMKGNG